MKRLLAKLGSTATPSRPRSELVHSFALRSSAGLETSAPFSITRKAPPCVVISSLPSGVNAIAVGEGTLATRASLNSAGKLSAALAPATSSPALGSVEQATSTTQAQRAPNQSDSRPVRRIHTPTYVPPS